MRLVKTPVKMADWSNVPAPGVHEVDPEWLEDAVLRVLKKHSVLPAARPAPVAADSGEVSIAFLFPQPSPAWRVLRGTLIAALVVGAAGVAARWRYPAQSAAALSSAKAGVTWISEHRPFHAPPPASGSPVPGAELAPPAPLPEPPHPALPVAEAQPPSISASPAASPDVTAPTAAIAPAMHSAEPPATQATAPAPIAKGEGVKLESAKIESAKVEAKSVPRAAHAPAPTPPVATPSAPSAPRESAPPPVPGSLDDAIRRAGNVRGSAPVVGSAASAHADAKAAPAPEAKAPADASLPDHPGASLVQAALMGALPDARACLGAGEETRAVVVFESSGAVNAVQVTGPRAACIQKALGHARVPPFAQPTYRAGVPIRASGG